MWHVHKTSINQWLVDWDIRWQPQEAVLSCVSMGQGYKGLESYSQTCLKSIWSLSCRYSYYVHCTCLCKNSLNFFFLSCPTLLFLYFLSVHSSFPLSWWTGDGSGWILQLPPTLPSLTLGGAHHPSLPQCCSEWRRLKRTDESSLNFTINLPDCWTTAHSLPRWQPTHSVS